MNIVVIALFFMNSFAVYTSERGFESIRQYDARRRAQIELFSRLTLLSAQYQERLAGLSRHLRVYEDRLDELSREHEAQLVENRSLRAQLESAQHELRRSRHAASGLLPHLNQLSGECIRVRAELAEAQRQLALAREQLAHSREQLAPGVAYLETRPQAVATDVVLPERLAGFLASAQERAIHAIVAQMVSPYFWSNF